jgi:agenet domain-containing protein
MIKKTGFFLSIFLIIFSPLGVHARTETKPETKPETRPETQASSSTSSYSKGDKVEALWHGAWYRGVIEQSYKEDRYKVSFYGYWHSRDEIMPSQRIRKIPKREYPQLSDMKAGEAVEFMEDDHWRPGVFVEARKYKALIRYADGEKTKETEVSYMKLWKPPMNTSKDQGQ